MKIFQTILILIHDHAIFMFTLQEDQHDFLGARVSIHFLIQASSIVASVCSYGRNVFPQPQVIVR